MPYLSVIVRFSDRFATERTVWSMKFWLDMYRLNNFYSYLEAKLLSIERSNKKIGKFYQDLIELVNNSNVSTKRFVKELIDDYFFRNLSYKALKTQLDGFHDLNFHAQFKFADKTFLTPEKIDELYEDFRLRTNFFRKFKSFFNATTVMLNYYSRRTSPIDSSETKSLISLRNRSELLSEELKAIVVEEKKNKSLLVQQQFVKICCMFNVISKFVTEVVEHPKFQ